MDYTQCLTELRTLQSCSVVPRSNSEPTCRLEHVNFLKAFPKHLLLKVGLSLAGLPRRVCFPTQSQFINMGKFDSVNLLKSTGRDIRKKIAGE